MFVVVGWIVVSSGNERDSCKRSCAASVSSFVLTLGAGWGVGGTEGSGLLRLKSKEAETWGNRG
jgi:hypothetical protein